MFNYAKALLQLAKPDELKAMTGKEEIILKSGVGLATFAGDLSTLRGHTACISIVDECAFIKSEDQSMSANPLEELITALEPELLPETDYHPAAKLIGISSPFERKGLLFSKYELYYGSIDPYCLVWKSDTLSMNKTFSKMKIAFAKLRNPTMAASEWEGEFRDTTSSFVNEVNLSAAMVRRTELPQVGRKYYAALDSASGQGGDSYCMALSFKDPTTGRICIARMEERQPPFHAEEVTKEYAAIMREYKITEVVSDRYNLGWVADELAKPPFFIRNKYSPHPKDDLFKECVGRIDVGQVELLNDDRLFSQFMGLTRRIDRGVERIEHGVAHDDLANACALAVWACLDATTYSTLSPEALEAAGPVTSKPILPFNIERRKWKSVAEEMGETFRREGATPASVRQPYGSTVEKPRYDEDEAGKKKRIVCCAGNF